MFWKSEGIVVARILTGDMNNCFLTVMHISEKQVTIYTTTTLSYLSASEDVEMLSV